MKGLFFIAGVALIIFLLVFGVWLLINTASSRHIDTVDGDVAEYISSLENEIAKKDRVINLSKRIRLLLLIEGIAYEENVDFLTIVSIIIQESRFNPNAVSSEDCIGLMQTNWKVHGLNREDMFDPEKNVRAGIKIYKMYLEKYGSEELALYRYFGVSEFGLKYANQVLLIKKSLENS